MNRSSRQASLGFIFITVVIDVLGGGIIVPVLPRLIETSLAGNVSQASQFYGLLIALYSLMSFLFASLVGNLSDRFGRRPVLLLSLLGLAVDYTIIALAPNLAWLVVGRIIAGILGASFVTATAYIADISAPQERARNFGVLGAAFGLGFIVGPLLGGVLGGIDLRLPFWVAAGLAGLNMLYGLFVLPESLRPEHRRPLSWAHANPVGSLLALRRFPGVLPLTAVYVLTCLALNGLVAVWVLYTGQRFGWNVTQVGLSLAAVGISQAVAQGALVGPLVNRFGERRTIVAGVALSALAYVLYGLANQPWLLYVAIVVSAAGGVVAPALQGAVSGRVAPDQQGLLQGALASLNNLTNVVAPPVVAGVFAYALSHRVPAGVPLFLCAVFEGAAFLVALRAFRPPGTAASPTEMKAS